MEFNPQYILLALAPVFLGLVVAEAIYLRNRQGEYPSATYSLADTFSNGALALMHEMTDAFAAIAVMYLYVWLFEFRIFEIEAGILSFIALFFVQDFLYYWFHRASHRIRWFWASHVVHHSSEKLNLSTAFRQSFTYPVSGMWLFWLPMPVIGFSPEMVVTMVMLSLAYQFFIHTQLVKKLGKWEYVLNTPSHHRVHHGKNPEYIDKNYGGTLIIWDRLFGTFVEEREDTPVIYGITQQVSSHNPLYLTLHEWRDMANDAFAPGISLNQRLKHVFGPPEWTAPESVAADCAAMSEQVRG